MCPRSCPRWSGRARAVRVGGLLLEQVAAQSVCGVVVGETYSTTLTFLWRSAMVSVDMMSSLLSSLVESRAVWLIRCSGVCARHWLVEARCCLRVPIDVPGWRLIEAAANVMLCGSSGWDRASRLAVRWAVSGFVNISAWRDLTIFAARRRIVFVSSPSCSPRKIVRGV